MFRYFHSSTTYGYRKKLSCKKDTSHIVRVPFIYSSLPVFSLVFFINCNICNMYSIKAGSQSLIML